MENIRNVGRFDRNDNRLNDVVNLMGIGKLCILTLPCQHTCYLELNDGEIIQASLFGDDIWKLIVEKKFPDYAYDKVDYEHFMKYYCKNDEDKENVKKYFQELSKNDNEDNTDD
jgi:hypothetical protein